ncbi:phage protein Gp27 family protein [Klebsiella oxytoca]|uniref:phage protein Gp27 family protein n=1 Tax=Klebsiella oxytoca TaxID=571 RepID=UPI0038BD008D
MDHLGRFSKNTTETVLKIRREVASQAADKAVETGRRFNLSPEALETIRREVYGIAA